MRKLIYALLIIIPGFILDACEDIIEKDISKKSIILLSPPEEFQTNVLTHTFWWEEMDGAESYKLQIVSPEFNSIQRLLLDTEITNSKFIYSFAGPGNYAWRVKGLNNGSETKYYARALYIDSTLDLSDQIVTLIEPAESEITSNTSINFRWNLLYNANEYRFQLIEGGSSAILVDTLLDNPTLSLQLDSNTYIWKVRAENDLSVSLYSSRQLQIDFTPPQVSTPISPQSGDTVSNPVELVWQRYAGAAYDSLYIYSDSTLTNIQEAALVNDTIYSFSGTVFVRYYWILRSFDLAGNGSSYSATANFRIQ